MEVRNAIPAFYLRKPVTASRSNSAYWDRAEGVDAARNSDQRRVVAIVKDKQLSNPQGLCSGLSDAFASTQSRNGSAARAYRQTAQSKEKSKSSIAQESEPAMIDTAKWYHQQMPRILDEARQRQEALANKLFARIYTDFESRKSQGAKVRDTQHNAALTHVIFRPSAQELKEQGITCTEFTRNPRGEAAIEANRKVIARLTEQSTARERREKPMSREDVAAFMNQGWGGPAVSHMVTHKRIHSCLGQMNRTIILDRDEKQIKKPVKVRPLDLPPRARTPASVREDKAVRPPGMIRQEPSGKAKKIEVVVDALDDINDAREVLEATAGGVGIGLPVKVSFASGFFN